MKTHIRYVALLILGFVLMTILLATCGGAPPAAAPPASGSAPPAPTPTISWALTPVANFTDPATGTSHQLLRVGNVAGVALPTTGPQQALDILIMGAGSCTDSSSNPCGYENKTLAQFYEDVKPFMRDVFGAANVLGAGPYDGPFNFYVTDYEYSQATPAGGKCDLGLPPEWASEPNFSYDGPAFDCSIALSTAPSTAAPELNIGFIVHRGNVPDRNKFSLFSAEYNSYAAILHELSHAAFVMSDEAPIAAGRFFPTSYPNLYNGTCPPNSCAGGSCESIGSGYSHCTGAAGNDTNLMYFATPVPPGSNSGWGSYGYQFASIDRLNYIYTEKCAKGLC
jgi:hypothetical protein